MTMEEKHKQPKATRNKNGTITVKGFFHSCYVNLKIITTPADWDGLESCLLECSKPDGDCEEFISDLLAFTGSALAVLKKKKPRGRNKCTSSVVEQIKEEAGWLYPFFKYYCDKPLESWPEPLRSVVDMVKRHGKGISIEITSKVKTKYDPQMLTAYCIGKVRRKQAIELGMNAFRDAPSFYNTYIMGTTSYKKSMSYIRGKKNPTEIERTFTFLIRRKQPPGDTSILF